MVLLWGMFGVDMNVWLDAFLRLQLVVIVMTVTVMGLQVGFLIGGAIVVETLFAMPGLGTFGIDAIIARDYQQVQGFALITALAFVVINLLVDMTYTFLDPRIRYT